MSRADRGGKKPCCMISEILEEAGLDRERARRLRREVLEGIMLLCQRQLERMERSRPRSAAKKARKIRVE